MSSNIKLKGRGVNRIITSKVMLSPLAGVTDIIFIATINVNAMQGNLDLSSAQTSVGKRFAKVFCDAKREGLDSDFASEYALNNTYLKFVAFPDDDEYLADLWNFTHNNILDNCGEFVDINDLKDLEIFFKEEGLIASNRELYLPTFENN